MFTGIIERTLQVFHASDHVGGRRIVLPNPWPDAALGESIAVDGVCLTIADIDPMALAFHVIPETLDKTNLGNLAEGDSVNVERALRVGGRLDGHFVQGHVDGVGTFVNKIANDDEWRFTIQAPPGVAKYLSPKGSICVDGVSLTIAALAGNRFEVALIPTTLKLTTLAARDVGYAFNLEADLIAKQIVTFLDARKL
ncbi:MAG: riboflavin synthase subunit alpha [Phycisphaerales bacterium]|nr:riboflavin synthase subunit alpha [Phycisphaerales bacterium]